MNYLLKQSLHQQIPIDMIYMKKTESAQSEKSLYTVKRNSSYKRIVYRRRQ